MRFQKLGEREEEMLKDPIRQTFIWNHTFQICLWKSSQCDLLANAVKPAEMLLVSESNFSLVVVLQVLLNSNAHWKHNCKEGKFPLPGETTRSENPSRDSLISKSTETYPKIHIQRFASCLSVLLLRPEVWYYYGTFPRQQQQLPNLFTRCKSVSVIIIIDGLLVFSCWEKIPCLINSSVL